MAGSHAEAGGAGDAGNDDDKKAEVELLSVSWNQDNSHFTAATTADFRVFECYPFRELFRRVHEDGTGGFAAAEMLFRTNIFATTVQSSSSSSSKVELWDDRARRRLWQRGYAAGSAVRAVRLSPDRVAIVVDRAVRVYDLWNPARLLREVDTAPNPRGLCCLCSSSESSVMMACPGTDRGQVRVEDLGRVAKTRLVIAAHGSELACLAMNANGAILATASVKGTLVRVFSTMDGTCLQEVRRGRDNAEIYSIALSRDLQWLAVSSDKGTLHVFSLRIKEHAGVPAASSSNARSSLSFMKWFLLSYFSSEWSFAQFRLPEHTGCFVAFGEENDVMILGMDASFCKCSFDPVSGGEMARKEYFRFLND